MKKTKLTRSLLAACSIVALSAVMYGCTHSSGPSQDELDAALADKATAETEAEAAKDQSATDTEARMTAEEQSATDAEARMTAEEQSATDAEARMTAEEQSALDAQAKTDADAAAATALEAQMKAEEEAAAAEEARIKAEEKAAAAEEAQMEAEDEEKAAADALAAKEAAEKAGMLTALYAGIFGPIDDPLTAFNDAEPTILAAHGMLATIIAPAAATDPQPTGHDAAFGSGTSSALDALGDWSGTDMVARNGPGGFTDHVNVYTDVNVGTEMTFEMLFPESSADTVVQGAYDEATRVVDDSGLNMHQGLIMATMEDDDGEMVNAFQSGSGSEDTWQVNSELSERRSSIPGTFAGATGTYELLVRERTTSSAFRSGTNDGTDALGRDWYLQRGFRAEGLGA